MVSARIVAPCLLGTVHTTRETHPFSKELTGLAGGMGKQMHRETKKYDPGQGSERKLVFCGPR